MRDKDLTLQTDEGGTLRSPFSIFCSVSEHLPPASSRPAPVSSRPGGSHFQQSWQLFRTDRGRPSLQNPRFQAFRAQNRHFCALFAFGTPVLGHFEHKIEIFVSETAIFPWFWPLSSTKSGFLCSEDWESGIGNPKIDIGNTESALPANHRAHL